MAQSHSVNCSDNAEFWIDRQQRPTIGITCKPDSNVFGFQDCNPNDFKTNLAHLISQAKTIPDIDDSSFGIYFNAKNQRSTMFHMKLHLDPNIFLSSSFGRHLPNDIEPILTERFDRDCYLKYLKNLDQKNHNSSSNIIYDVNNGPFILFSQTSNIETIYQLHLNVNEWMQSEFSDVWYSVCTFLNKDNEFCVGVKIDSTKFAERFIPTIAKRSEFIDKWKYKPPRRTYHQDTRHRGGNGGYRGNRGGYRGGYRAGNGRGYGGGNRGNPRGGLLY